MIGQVGKSPHNMLNQIDVKLGQVGKARVKPKWVSPKLGKVKQDLS